MLIKTHRRITKVLAEDMRVAASTTCDNCDLCETCDIAFDGSGRDPRDMDMPNSNEWLTPEKIEEAAEQLLAQDGTTIETLTAYQVGQALGRNANATVYRCFASWKARKLEEAAGERLQLPPALLKPLETLSDTFRTQFLAESSAVLSAVGRMLEEAANLKVAGAMRAKEEAEARTAEILALWERDEGALAAAEKEAGDWKLKWYDAHRRVLNLEGRISQLMIDREGSDPAPVVTEAAHAAEQEHAAITE